jgi:hypothetical protein
MSDRIVPPDGRSEAPRAGSADVAWPPGRQHLVTLLAALHSAQGEFQTARRPPTAPAEVHSARRTLLDAMSQYENALRACRLPVPRQLKREAQLLREVVAEDRRS